MTYKHDYDKHDYYKDAFYFNGDPGLSHLGFAKLGEEAG